MSPISSFSFSSFFHFLLVFRDSYNLVSKNCNHFADAFVFAMLNIHIPSYVNRLANLGNMVSCLFPPSLMNQAPVGQDNGGGGGGGGYQVSTPMSRRKAGSSGSALSSSSSTSSTSSSQVFSRAGFTLGKGAEKGFVHYWVAMLWNIVTFL